MLSQQRAAQREEREMTREARRGKGWSGAHTLGGLRGEREGGERLKRGSPGQSLFQLLAFERVEVRGSGPSSSVNPTTAARRSPSLSPSMMVMVEAMVEPVVETEVVETEAAHTHAHATKPTTGAAGPTTGAPKAPEAAHSQAHAHGPHAHAHSTARAARAATGARTHGEKTEHPLVKKKESDTCEAKAPVNVAKGGNNNNNKVSYIRNSEI
eukprot:RCo010732